jgi:hypothetical protein
MCTSRPLVLGCVLQLFRIGGALGGVDASPPDGAVANGGVSVEGAKAPRTFHIPVHALRQAAEGADKLTVVSDPSLYKSRTFLTVVGSKEIVRLLALIDTPPVEDGTGMGHGCGGFPHIRLFRRGVMVAEFSFDHVSMLRPLSDNLWSGGDVSVTDASARAIAAWFDRKGFHVYKDDLDREDRDRAKQEAFLKSFPPSIEAILRDADETKPEGDVLASVIPNNLERTKVICHALGSLDSYWFGIPADVGLVLGWAESLSSQSLAAAIDGFGDKSVELRGAAQLLFGWRPGASPRLANVDLATRDRVIARAATAIFDGPLSDNQRKLPLRIMHLTLPKVEKVLQRQAERVQRARNDSCPSLPDEEPSLAALTALAGRGKADPRMVAAANRRRWKCSGNAAAAHIAAALAVGHVPNTDDIQAAVETSALVVLQHLRDFPTQTSIDLAFASLLDHKFGVVRGETADWLADLAGLHLPEEQGEDDTRTSLERWWSTARSGWDKSRNAVPTPARER